MVIDPSRVATVIIEKARANEGFGKRVQKTERVKWRILYSGFIKAGR